MKKARLSAVLIVLIGSMFFSFSAFAEEQYPFQGESEKSSTWIRFCLWPDVSFPTMKWSLNTHGLSIGIITYNKVGTVVGADLGLVNTSKNVRGVKIGIFTDGEYIEGVQGGIVNLNKNITGGQFGVYNSSKKMAKGVQIGVVNRSKKSAGPQIGLINIMDNGFLKVFPFFNFPTSR